MKGLIKGKKKGFTLIEIVVAISLLAVVTGIGYTWVNSSSSIFQRESGQINNRNEVRTLVEEIASKIEQSSLNKITIESKKIVINDISYYFVENDKTIYKTIGSGEANAYIKNVKDISFTLDTGRTKISAVLFNNKETYSIEIYATPRLTADVTSSGAKITSFIFEKGKNSALARDANGSIDETKHEITVVVPNNTDITKLIPTIKFEGTKIDPDAAFWQNFAKPITYTVTGGENKVPYIVTVIEDYGYLMTLDLAATPAGGVVVNPNENKKPIFTEADYKNGFTITGKDGTKTDDFKANIFKHDLTYNSSVTPNSNGAIKYIYIDNIGKLPEGQKINLINESEQYDYYVSVNIKLNDGTTNLLNIKVPKNNSGQLGLYNFKNGDLRVFGVDDKGKSIEHQVNNDNSGDLKKIDNAGFSWGELK